MTVRLKKGEVWLRTYELREGVYVEVEKKPMLERKE
jgi:hypothetical protein